MQKKEISVLGLGNPLMDYIVHVDFNFLEQFNAAPRTMNLVELAELKDLLLKIKDYVILPGGSCANTLRGIAWLDKSRQIKMPVFWGSVGNEEIGSCYIKMLKKSGVRSSIIQKDAQTGVSIVIVTPDFERTMFTYLGACRSATEQDMDFAMAVKAEIIHISGYLWDTKNQKKVVQRVVDLAREKGITISFDLADPFVVKRYREEFLNWIAEYVNILFGNREEFSLLFDINTNDTKIIENTKEYAEIVLLKVGKEGSYCCDNGNIFYIPARRAQALDTTGAGDSFAAGFLFGYLNKKPVEQCVKIATAIAGGIVTVEGCNYNKVNYDKIMELVK